MNTNSTHDSGGAKSPANAVTAPDMTAPTVRPVVGGVYGDRTGREHGPMTPDRLWNGGLRAPSGLTWKASGHFYDAPTVHAFDLITVVSEPGRDAQDEAASVTYASMMAAKIHSPETGTMHPADYTVEADADGNIKVACTKDSRRFGFDMSPAAARAIAHAILRITEGAE